LQYFRQDLITKIPSDFAEEVKLLFNIFDDKIRLVGGAVRNLIIDKKVNDFDFATILTPDQVSKILNQHQIFNITVNANFGTVIAVINHKNFEITTLRQDFKSNGRHCQPIFSKNYELDAQRRDFTINALYLDKTGNLFDYFNGINDLKLKRVKFIGDCATRIHEDYLRILRFWRFSLEFAEEYDKNGLENAIALQDNLKKLSSSRIRQELYKIILYPQFNNVILLLKKLENCGTMAIIINQKFNIDNFAKLLELVNKIKNLGNISIDKFLEAKIDKLKIASLLIDKETNISSLAVQIAGTKIEKKYWHFLQKNSQLFEKKLTKITNKNEIKILFKDCLVLNGDLTIELTIFYILNNWQFLLKQQLIEYLIELMEKAIETNFFIDKIINSGDIISANIIPNSKINYAVKIANIAFNRHKINYNKELLLKVIVKYFRINQHKIIQK